jgi:hypothetical protein
MSSADLFPAALFAYRPLDDVLHVTLGLGLVGLGTLGWRRGVVGAPLGMTRPGAGPGSG